MVRRSANPPRARRMRPADRRAQLVASAVAVSAHRGLGAARHTDVAAEAGVSRPAVFVYFPTTEALLGAVLAEVERHYLAMLEDVHRQEGPPRAELHAIARAFADSVDRHPAHARVWLDWSTAMRDGLRPRYLRFQRRVLQRLAATIRRGHAEGAIARAAGAEDAAQLMYTAAYAVLQMKLDGQPRARIDRFLGSVVDAVAPPAM